MSRPLRTWIAIRRERKAVRRRFCALIAQIAELRPATTYAQACGIAFRADMEAYRQLGRSITGAIWCKTKDGPRPRYPR